MDCISRSAPFFLFIACYGLLKAVSIFGRTVEISTFMYL